MNFIERVWEKTIKVVEAEVNHPHLQELAAGTLPIEKFRFQVKQNYKYLLQYTRAIAIAIAKSPDYSLMKRYRSYLDEVMDNEIPFYHKHYKEILGIGLEELDQTIMACIKRSYTSHELACSWEGDLAMLTISLLPCAVCYNEVAKRLIKICQAPQGSIYREWINMYISNVFTSAVQDIVELTNELTNNKTEAELKRLEEIYLVSCQYELLSWDMYYNMQKWPQNYLFEDL